MVSYRHAASKARILSSEGARSFNGSLSSQQSGEGDIRRRLVEADLVECIVGLPGQLFYTTQIPASLWFLNRDKAAGGARGWRDRRGETLFIDVRKLGAMVDRTHREFSNDDIARVARTYHAWRGEAGAGEYADIPGFCASITANQIAEYRHVLAPGRYVGAEEAEEDDEPADEKVARLTAELYEAFNESDRVQLRVRQVLERLHVE